MKVLKRLMLVFVLLISFVTLTACGGNKDGDGDTTEAELWPEDLSEYGVTLQKPVGNVTEANKTTQRITIVIQNSTELSWNQTVLSLYNQGANLVYDVANQSVDIKSLDELKKSNNNYQYFETYKSNGENNKFTYMNVKYYNVDADNRTADTMEINFQNMTLNIYDESKTVENWFTTEELLKIKMTSLKAPRLAEIYSKNINENSGVADVEASIVINRITVQSYKDYIEYLFTEKGFNKKEDKTTRTKWDDTSDGMYVQNYGTIYVYGYYYDQNTKIKMIFSYTESSKRLDITFYYDDITPPPVLPERTTWFTDEEKSTYRLGSMEEPSFGTLSAVRTLEEGNKKRISVYFTNISLDELKTFVENKLFNRLNAKKNALMETKTLNELIDETNGYKFMGYYYQDSKSSLQYDINYRVVVTYNVNETTGEFADSGDYLLAANSAILMFEVENVIPDDTGLVTGTTRLPSGDYTISALYESNIEDKDKNNKYYSEDRYVLTKIGDEYMRCNYYKINNADETYSYCAYLKKVGGKYLFNEYRSSTGFWGKYKILSLQEAQKEFSDTFADNRITTKSINLDEYTRKYSTTYDGKSATYYERKYDQRIRDYSCEYLTVYNDYDLIGKTYRKTFNYNGQGQLTLETKPYWQTTVTISTTNVRFAVAPKTYN